MAPASITVAARPPSPAARLMQWALWIVAALLIGWSFMDPRFRNTEGLITGTICFPVAAGAACFVAGWYFSALFRSAALWLALALIGQAAALQMIYAGTLLHYQHYQSYQQLLTGYYPFLLAVLGIQTILVALGLRKHGADFLRRLNGVLKRWQWIAVGLVFVGTSAVLSANPGFYLKELALATFIQAVNLGGIVLVACTLPEQTRVRIKQRFDDLVDGSVGTAAVTERIDRFVLIAALWTTLAAVLLCLFSYERHPHVPDEVAYLFQARVLADGALTVPAPAVPDAFNLYLLQIKGDAWYATTPPGWPLMLAVGVLFGIAWLVNPLLAGLNIVLIYVLLQSLYTRRIARIAVLLFCLSPWYLFMGMSFMPHMFTLTCALLAALGVVRARETGKAGRAWLGGVALGILSLIRPLDALIVAAVLGLWAIGLGGKRLKFSAIAGLVLGSMIIGALVLPYNKKLTGNPRVFPIMEYTDEHFHPNANALGFGPDRGVGWGLDPFPGHSPRDAMINADLNGFALNIELFGWSVGSLLLVSLMMFSGRMKRSDYLMLAVIAAVFTAHFFYYFSGGPDFGARYWFLMIVPLVALAAHAIVMLERHFAPDEEKTPSAGGYVTVSVLSLCLLSAVTFFPWRAIDKYYHFREMRPDIRSLAAAYHFGNSLVLIRGEKHPDFNSAATYNPIDLRSANPIYAWDKNPEVRADVLAAYADRPVWIVDGPALTGGAYKVVAGPLPATDLMQETP